MTKNYSEIGTVLRLAREEMGISLKDAAQSLHIRTHYLQALELGELGKLPNLIYAKGYLKIYCSFLGLDEEEIIRRFENIQNQLPERGFFFPHVFSSEKKPSMGAIWGGVLAVVLIYLIWVLAFKPASTPEFLVKPAPDMAIKESERFYFNAACSLAEKAIYPPCYWNEAVNGNTIYIPISSRKAENIMELAR